jgi:hypothetical protein
MCPSCSQLGDNGLKVLAASQGTHRQVEGVRVKEVLRVGSFQLCVLEKLLFIRCTTVAS